jgi:RsiW-degrading membrane proteinase PrsW (M82 family)
MFNEILSLIQSGFSVFFFALIGGLIPSLIWLWFWLHEESKHKEPRKVIFITFLLGMLGAFVALFIQYLFNRYFNSHIIDIENYKTINLIFVIIEEFVKFICAYVIFFRTKLFDEPIDAFIYLMTAAIGFAAMENSLHLIRPLIEGQTFELIVSTHIRFIGANILHVASSGLLALFIGYSFCKKPWIREMYIWFGLITATLAHWLFNLFLLTSVNSVVFVFLATWAVIIFIILSLENVKRIKCGV